MNDTRFDPDYTDPFVRNILIFLNEGRTPLTASDLAATADYIDVDGRDVPDVEPLALPSGED